MIDNYTMILWSKAKESSIDMQTKQVLDVLSILNKVEYLRPKYLTAYKKKDIQEFELSFENLKGLILKNRNKQCRELGSIVSFFTSLVENESVGISMTVGVSNPKFINTIVIKLGVDIKKQKMIDLDKLADIFKKMVKISNPFYGCITCKSNKNMFGGYYNNERNIPNSIFDVNYLGKDIISHLKICEEVLSKVYEYEKIDGGYYIRFQKDPIDITNREHIELQKEINYLFGI